MVYAVNTPQVICERFENEVIVIHLEKGTYFSLRETAADAWVRLEAGQSEEAILAHWRQAFPGEANLDQDLQSFLKTLLEEGLVRSDVAIEQTFTEITLNAYSAPRLEVYTDMKDLLLLDPVHDVDETGWPAERKR